MYSCTGPAKIIQATPTYQEVIEGEQIEMKCVVTGMPTPHVQIVKVVSASVSQPGTDTEQMTDNASAVNRRKVIKHAELSDSGVYSCFASNTLVNPPQGIHKTTDTATFFIKVVPSKGKKSR